MPRNANANKNAPYVTPDPAAPPIDPHRYGGLSTDDLAADVRNCVERIGAAGHDVLVVEARELETLLEGLVGAFELFFGEGFAGG